MTAREDRSLEAVWQLCSPVAEGTSLRCCWSMTNLVSIPGHDGHGRIPLFNRRRVQVHLAHLSRTDAMEGRSIRANGEHRISDTSPSISDSHCIRPPRRTSLSAKAVMTFAVWYTIGLYVTRGLLTLVSFSGECGLDRVTRRFGRTLLTSTESNGIHPMCSGTMR